MQIPTTRRDEDQIETLHGHRIADPYRWLEDPDSPETAEWVTRQNAAGSAYLAGLPERAWFSDRMRQIVRRPTTGVPRTQGGRILVDRNDGRHAQPIWYVADSLDELRSGGRMLLDPNAWSDDGTVSVRGMSVSPDGTTLAYAASDGGSDWATFHLIDIDTAEPVADAPISSKFSAPAWLPDSRSYLYLQWDHTGEARGTSSEINAASRRMLHRVGTDTGTDRLVFECPDDPELQNWEAVSHDGRFVVLTLTRGTNRSGRTWVYRIGDDGMLGEPRRIIDVDESMFGFVRSDGDQLYFHTDDGAERGRVVRLDLGEFERTGEVTAHTVVPEGDDTIDEVVAAGDHLLVARLVDAQTVITRYALDGTDCGTLDLPPGALLELRGEAGAPHAFVGLSTVVDPSRIWHIDPASGHVEPLDLADPDEGGFSAPQITVTRARTTSKDGTTVPYFLIRPAHAPAGPVPTILYGYGGFDIPMQPGYRPAWPAWLSAGGCVAIANLRGGGEFGTSWYEDGRLERKQHVFDDCIAVAEHLIETGATTARQLAVHGGSNGGLLVGAVLTQRPDLFAAAIPAVGVLDLLRFHKFTIGASWKSDYGDPDDPADFEVALAYSPLHNVHPGTAYPPTLVLTGDHDDRVVPLHSHKFTATLQHAQAGDGPVLTRIETRAGHGMGKPKAVIAAECADWLAFAAHHTGLEVPADAG